MEKSPYSRRGGLSGKGQRARGKRGFGRPAAFGTRLYLEGDKVRKDETEMTEEELEQAQEDARKYGRRDLGSNAHRYDEPEETEKADGEEEEEPEPEIDLSKFLEKQRLAPDDDNGVLSSRRGADDDDIDHSLDNLLDPSVRRNADGRKHIETVEWTQEMEAMAQEKSQADAARDLASRFRSRVEKQAPTKSSQKSSKAKAASESVEVDPTVDLFTPKVEVKPQTDQDFLDDLLG
ncbi:hypothetical protein FRC04_004202 [Tulasnella sp. 424]|nr:hypothetical protein FRC04_004202 [Tulasnella sp. 424]KAG8964035.1 hypothetical protein FRC05_004319 [Tulasnella sp. 425]